jgi:heme/copper-type cytochrome/quinol oxidase subunit 2
MNLKRDARNTYLSLIWTPIITLILAIVAFITIYFFQSQQTKAPLENFDEMTVTQGFHRIDLKTGEYYVISYEKDRDSIFDGLVRHTEMDHEKSFPILSFDILVTTGEYSDPTKVKTRVEDHHFMWKFLMDRDATGTINLLHTVPMNQAIEDQLMQIKEGDHVVIIGREILKIDGYSRFGKYLGYWQDAGCNTILITEVYINP